MNYIDKIFKSEFLRYVIIGGISFCIDFGTIVLLREVIFHIQSDFITIIYNIIAFITAFIFNYFASLKFVFNEYSVDNNAKGMTLTLIIAVIGLLLTISLMYIGEFWLHIDYRPLKIIVSGLVLFWNYIGRKYFVFNQKK